MGGLTGWDWAIYGIAGYLAISSLIRLMLARRNQLTAKLREKGLADLLRKRQEEREAARKAARKGSAA